MGINGLLQQLKSISRPTHVSTYKGQKVAVDGFSWLHKGAYCCAPDLCEGRWTEGWVTCTSCPGQPVQACGIQMTMADKTRRARIVTGKGWWGCTAELVLARPCRMGKRRYPLLSPPAAQRGGRSAAQHAWYVRYFLARIDMLLGNGVQPVVVFDGCRLPMKADEEDSRRKSRREALERAMQHVDAGNPGAAVEFYQRAVNITSRMVKVVIEALRERGGGVQWLVAPYEADAQMAALALAGEVAAVLTEDSDLLAYGCPKVLFKLDKSGNGEEVALSDMPLNKEINLAGFTHDMLVQMCILAGCDFLPNLPGVGMKKAHALMRKYRDFLKVVRALRFSGVSIPPNYEATFQRTLWVFRHQRVYCSRKRALEHLRPLPAGGIGGADVAVLSALPPEGPEREALAFLGPLLEPDTASGIAAGDLDPSTRQPFDLASIYQGCRHLPQHLRHLAASQQQFEQQPGSGQHLRRNSWPGVNGRASAAVQQPVADPTNHSIKRYFPKASGAAAQPFKPPRPGAAGSSNGHQPPQALSRQQQQQAAAGGEAGGPLVVNLAGFAPVETLSAAEAGRVRGCTDSADPPAEGSNGEAGRAAAGSSQPIAAPSLFQRFAMRSAEHRSSAAACPAGNGAGSSAAAAAPAAAHNGWAVVDGAAGSQGAVSLGLGLGSLSCSDQDQGNRSQGGAGHEALGSLGLGPSSGSAPCLDDSLGSLIASGTCSDSHATGSQQLAAAPNPRRAAGGYGRRSAGRMLLDGSLPDSDCASLWLRGSSTQGEGEASAGSAGPRLLGALAALDGGKRSVGLAFAVRPTWSVPPSPAGGRQTVGAASAAPSDGALPGWAPGGDGLGSQSRDAAPGPGPGLDDPDEVTSPMRRPPGRRDQPQRHRASACSPLQLAASGCGAVEAAKASPQQRGLFDYGSSAAAVLVMGTAAPPPPDLGLGGLCGGEGEGEGEAAVDRLFAFGNGRPVLGLGPPPNGTAAAAGLARAQHGVGGGSADLEGDEDEDGGGAAVDRLFSSHMPRRAAAGRPCTSPATCSADQPQPSARPLLQPLRATGGMGSDEPLGQQLQALGPRAAAPGRGADRAPSACGGDVQRSAAHTGGGDGGDDDDDDVQIIEDDEAGAARGSSGAAGFHSVDHVARYAQLSRATVQRMERAAMSAGAPSGRAPTAQLQSFAFQRTGRGRGRQPAASRGTANVRPSVFVDADGHTADQEQEAQRQCGGGSHGHGAAPPSSGNRRPAAAEADLRRPFKAPRTQNGANAATLSRFAYGKKD